MNDPVMWTLIGIAVVLFIIGYSLAHKRDKEIDRARGRIWPEKFDEEGRLRKPKEEDEDSS